ncbi:MAG: class I SAM-dependent methyltransferase [Deltaproteobacteria bacterium]|nr:class I SAM-dependent methyltransferase [Deltaproteobacteria bacterium]
MKTNPSNTWLTEKGKQQVDYYTASKDVILVERKRTSKLLFDLFRYHFDTTRPQKILDLGCGDGEMALQFSDKFPNNQFYLMDGSHDMLSKAQDSLKGDNIHFIKKTFEEYLSNEPVSSKYNFIYSSNAIHHLDFSGKSQLFARVFSELAQNGMFIIIDLVRPPSEQCEKWQFRMWVDWINQTLAESGREDEAGKHDGLPGIYKAKAENQPDGLFEQLEVLRKCGFRDVDCFYKYGVFTLFGGIK